MNRIINVFIGIIILVSFLSLPALTQAVKPETISVSSLIQTLQQQIENLKTQILQLQNQLTSLKQAEGEVKESTEQIRETLRLTRRLWRGMTNEDVTLLQEMLATDPEIYPEGLITGYFGPLTERAVKKFQKKMGVEQVGVVGPKTLAKINELLTEGAGSSGKVPPGLLIAPGIRKKIGYTPQPPADQVLPPGIAKKIDGTTTTTPDVTSPVISGVEATSTIATSTKITWTTDEEADSKVYYDTATPLVVTTTTMTVTSPDLVLNHELELSGLSTSTAYYYLVTSSDGAGNIATSTEQSFTTLSE